MKKIVIILIAAVLFGCKKKETKPSNLNIYKVEIKSYTPLSSDTMFYSFDYWFLNSNNNAIPPQYAQSFNSMLTEDLKNYRSDSCNNTHRIYTGMSFSDSKEFTLNNTIPFVLSYRIGGFRKDSKKQYWYMSPVQGQSIKVYKNNELMYERTGTSEISENVSL